MRSPLSLFWRDRRVRKREREREMTGVGCATSSCGATATRSTAPRTSAPPTPSTTTPRPWPRSPDDDDDDDDGPRVSRGGHEFDLGVFVDEGGGKVNRESQAPADAAASRLDADVSRRGRAKPILSLSLSRKFSSSKAREARSRGRAFETRLLRRWPRSWTRRRRPPSFRPLRIPLGF